jgi:hypothetical protein
MRSSFVGLCAALLLFVPPSYAADRVPSQEAVAFAISKSGESWAYISAKPFVLEVRRSGQKLRAPMKELDAVSDVSPTPSIEWSQDGQYILITYRNEESASSVEVYDARSLKRLIIHPVTDARWLKAGTEFVAVPASGELGENESRGLLIFNVKTGAMRRVADQYIFVGRLDAGDKYVIAQSLKKGVQGKTEFVRVNAASGAVDE